MVSLVELYNQILNENTIIQDLSSNEMSKYIYRDDEYDPRFQNYKDGGKFKYLSSDDFNSNEVRFFIIKENDLVVGLAHIRKSPYTENTWWLSYLSIDKDYQNKGYASKLTDYIFKWFNKNNLNFETSSYTEEGMIKLKPLFNKLAQKYKVKFIDKGKF